MAEVTAVPLQPIRKGSLVKLWLGVIALIAAGAALAWLTVPGKVSVTTITAGMGASPTDDDVVYINYVGKLADGKVFDQGQGVPLPLKGMIPGFTEGLKQMQKGGKYTLEIPAAKGYGAEEKTNPQTGEVVIPANSDLTFDIDLLDFMSRSDFERRAQMMQQLQQMQQQKEAGAAPPPQ
jgi:FKBP-type peptidyl-prolyl cis-trans isomerase FkpA